MAKAMGMTCRFADKCDFELMFNLTCIPVVLGDQAYQLLQDYASKRVFKHETKKALNELRKSFTAYMRAFWSVMDVNMQADICDCQDEMEEMLRIHKQQFWLAIHQSLTNVPRDVRGMLCDFMVCRAIIEIIYLVDAKFRGSKSPLLSRCMRLCSDINLRIMHDAGVTEDIDPNKVDLINNTAQVFVNKITTSKITSNKII